MSDFLPIRKGVVVRPAGDETPLDPGAHGAVAIGPDHLAGIGPVVRILASAPDGERMLITLGAEAFLQFGVIFNQTGRRIQSGEFDAPPVVQ